MSQYFKVRHDVLWNPAQTVALLSVRRGDADEALAVLHRREPAAQVPNPWAGLPRG